MGFGLVSRPFHHFWRWFQCSTGRLGELQNLGLGTVGLQLPLAVREQLPLAVREPKLRHWALGMA